jgi:hypothetical protein
MDLGSERWRVRLLELPRPWRYCTSCAAASAFVCSGRFRFNANKKSLDVWGVPPGQPCIHFDVPFRCDIRLDRLLAGELGISRIALQARYGRDELRRRVRDGLVLVLSG